MDTNKLIVKRGDDLYLVCTYTDANDVLIDLTSVQIESKVMDTLRNHVTDLVVTKLDQATNKGKYTVTYPLGFYPVVGSYLWDIQYTESGFKQSTETMSLEVIEDVV